MSADNAFQDKVKAALDFQTPIDHMWQDRLRLIVQSIQDYINVAHPNMVYIEVVPDGAGGLYGRQFSVILKIPNKQYQEKLFRTYICSDDKPIFLDFWGDDLIECKTNDALENHILEFLSKIKQKMSEYLRFAWANGT